MSKTIPCLMRDCDGTMTIVTHPPTKKGIVKLSAKCDVCGHHQYQTKAGQKVLQSILNGMPVGNMPEPPNEPPKSQEQEPDTEPKEDSSDKRTKWGFLALGGVVVGAILFTLIRRGG